MANDTLTVLAEELLGEAITALTCAGIAPPELQYVGFGLIPWDCELLAVNINPPGFLPLDRSRSSCQIAPIATFVLTDLRCYPTQDEQGNPPSAAEMEVASAAIYADLWVLQRTLARHTADGTLFGAAVACQDTKMQQAAILDPAGGLGGFTFSITAMPQDLDPLCGS